MKPSRMIAQAIDVITSAQTAAKLGGLQEGRSVLASKYQELQRYYQAECPRMNANPVYCVLQLIKGRSLNDFKTKLIWARQDLLELQRHFITQGQ